MEPLTDFHLPAIYISTLIANGVYGVDAKNNIEKISIIGGAALGIDSIVTPFFTGGPNFLSEGKTLHTIMGLQLEQTTKNTIQNIEIVAAVTTNVYHAAKTLYPEIKRFLNTYRRNL